MMWQDIFFLCIVSLAENVHGRTSIINGKDANIKDFPHQVSIRLLHNHFCGGAIVTEKHVVTAGHCLEDYSEHHYEYITVVTGSSYRDGKHGHIHKVALATIHPKFYNDKYRTLHDIAVITLENHIVFNAYQNKIDLPKHNYKAGDKAVITGYGVIKERPVKTYPIKLQKLKTKLMSIEDCEKTLVNHNKTELHDTEICTVRKDNSGVCYGDSGGPLIANGEFVGISAWFDGDDDCVPGHHPDVFTNVFKYKHFIESVIREE